MRNPVLLLPIQRPVVSQERLQMLRDLDLKRRDLFLLMNKIAEKVLDDLRNGAQIEPGKWQVKILTRQRGLKRIQELSIY